MHRRLNGERSGQTFGVAPTEKPTAMGSLQRTTVAALTIGVETQLNIANARDVSISQKES